MYVCMYLCCMYVCMCVRMCICTCVCMVCMYVCICVCKFSISLHCLQLFVYPMDVQMEDTVYALAIAPVQLAGREQDAMRVK